MTTDSPTGTDLVFAQASLRERMEWARAIAAAGDLVPAGLRNRDGSPNAAKVLLVSEVGSSLGIHPAIAINNIHVIEGKTTLSAALMSMLVRRAGHKLRIVKKGNVSDGTFEATATIIRADDPTFEYTATWNLERAKRAGLAGKGNWNKYFEAQCKARAISEVAREGAEDALMGVAYTPEDFGAVMTDDGELIREDLIEDAELVDADGNPESNRNPGHNEARGVANETEVMTRPDRQTTRPADTRPRASRTVENSGTGRPDDPAHDEHAVADEWADRARKAITVTDARDLYRDANHRGILGYALTSGELLGDVLRARGEHLADEEAHAADEALDVPTDEEVPLELPY